MSKFIILLAFLAVGYQAQARLEPSGLCERILGTATGFENFIFGNIQDSLDQIKKHWFNFSNEVNFASEQIRFTIQQIKDVKQLIADAGESGGNEVFEEMVARGIQDLKAKVGEFIIEASKTVNETARNQLNNLIELLEEHLEILEGGSSATRTTVARF